MDDAMREALLPCPFCGSTARLGVVTDGGEANPDFGGHFVQCDNERCHGCMGLRFACGDDPRPELIKAWNNRAAAPAQPSQAGLPDGIAKALDRVKYAVGHVSIDAMEGDNLAVTLCTRFDDPDAEEDDSGWSEAAVAGCDATLAAIHALYEDAILASLRLQGGKDAE